MERIKVWHIAGTINRYDFIDTIVRHIDRERFEVGVVTFRRESNIEPPRYEEVGIPHRVVPVPSYRAYGAYGRAAWRLSQILRQEGVQILHAHHYWESVIAALIKRFYPAIKIVLSRHYTWDILRLGFIKRKVLLWMENWSYQMADRLVVPTEYMARLVKQLHTGGVRVEVIPYGFEFSAEKYRCPSQEGRWAVRTEQGVSEEHFVVINVASHRVQKGQHVLLKAFQEFYAAVPQARLWLVGEGPDTPMLKALAEELGLLGGGAQAPCRFLGWRRGLEVRDLMAAADLMVHPTFSEAFPQVMVEGLSLGLPLVITPVSGAVDYLLHGETAWFVPIDNVEALKEALLYLYLHPHERASMAEKGRSFVREKFSYVRVNREYERLYESLI